MSIEHYQTPEALTLLDRIGRSEWLAIYATAGNERLAFHDEGPKPFFEVVDDQWEQRELPDYVALCILRNQLWEYIEEYYGGTILIEHDDDGALLAECAKIEKN